MLPIIGGVWWFKWHCVARLLHSPAASEWMPIEHWGISPMETLFEYSIRRVFLEFEKSLWRDTNAHLHKQLDRPVWVENSFEDGLWMVHTHTILIRENALNVNTSHQSIWMNLVCATDCGHQQAPNAILQLHELLVYKKVLVYTPRSGP